MFKRIAALLLLVCLLAPAGMASGRGRDDDSSVVERIIRFVRAHIPPMFVAKPSDDLYVPHP
jgi:hypothetical protein